MRKYNKPIIKEEILLIEDIIANSFGGNRPGDVIDTEGFIW